MAWYDEAIFYHIYPLGLCDAPKENAYEAIVHRLGCLRPWIDHIHSLGCNAIYIGPHFESVGHGYETTDYKKLDSRLGDNLDLTDFVKTCHENGIRVIFDGVFNHVGRDFFAFRDVKEKREASAYKDWFCNINFYGNNEYNDGFSYENWGGYNLLVKLNQRNPAVRDYIADVVRFWVKEFDIDGIRLDAADVLDFDFMKMLRAVASEVKPEFWLMGEVIHGDYTRWVNEGTLHSVTNYHLHKALYSGHNDHNYFEIAHTVKRLYGMGQNRPDGLKLYNFVDNHDVERIYTKLSNKAHFSPVHVLLYTLPGIPSIYYGSEFAIEGKKEKYSDASLRPFLNYEEYKNAINDNPNTALIAALGRIRQTVKALSYGTYHEVMLTNRQYAFCRSFDDCNVFVTANNDDCDYSFRLNGVTGNAYVGALSGQHVCTEQGSICVTVKANSAEIWVPLAIYEQIPDAPKLCAVTCSSANNDAEIAKEDISACAVPGKEAEASSDKVAETSSDEVAQSAPCASAHIVFSTEEVNTDENLCEKMHGKEEKSPSEEDKIKEAFEKGLAEGKIAGLQEAILAIMEKNGYVTDQMRKDVLDNVYHDSLINWVKSFR